jgi:hypothetical protein
VGDRQQLLLARKLLQAQVLACLLKVEFRGKIDQGLTLLLLNSWGFCKVTLVGFGGESELPNKPETLCRH